MSKYERQWKAAAVGEISRLVRWSARGIAQGHGFRSVGHRVAFFCGAHLSYHTRGWQRQLLKAGLGG